jgi:hypothetical protein
VDVYVATQRYGLGEILRWFDARFASAPYDRVHVLVYFKDAEEQPMPDVLVPLDWSEVTRFFENTVNVHMTLDDRRRRALEGAGLEPDAVIEAYKQHVDRTLIREQLRRSVDARVRNMMAALRFAEALRDAAVRQRTR